MKKQYDFSLLDELDEGDLILRANDGHCVRRKSGRRPRHIIINGGCVLCKSMTYDFYEEMLSALEERNDQMKADLYDY